MIHVAIMGFGTVGSGVYEVIKENNESIGRRAGDLIDVRYILDIRDFPNHEAANLFTKDFEQVVNDPEVGIVVEVMGGLEPAYTYSKRALMAGKHVVTSNKELVATHGAELLRLAEENGVNYLFEASVGGGIPIIRPLNQCLAANKISDIMGILNGTTNYILEKMIREGVSFEDALKDAQDKGYAERNPEADVEGHDTCRKIAIMTSLVFGKQVDYNLIETEGITNIDLDDVLYAESLDAVIKLIGYSKLTDDKVFARVCPMLIPNVHPLSNVNGVFNAIFVSGNAIGDVMFYGRGAGKLPTASAVVADVIDSAKHIHTHIRLSWTEGTPNMMMSGDDMDSTWLVRVSMEHRGKIEEAFTHVKWVFVPGKEQQEIGAVISHVTEAEFQDKISSIPGIIKKIRIAQ